MNYKNHYDNLINRAQHRTLETYTENHHIIPRCMGGIDDKTNLVRLTPEEHYLAHQLLVKIYPENIALINAAIMMIPNRPSNKLYGWLRRRFATVQSDRQTGENNNQFGSRWIHNISLKQSKKIKKSEPIPFGWNEGRKINFSIISHTCKMCNTQFTPQRLEIYCSEDCKKSDRSESIIIIDQNLNSMISYYQKVWSIDKTLKHFGVIGNRAGNQYFSSILKERKLYIRRRRNSSQSIASDAPDL